MLTTVHQLPTRTEAVTLEAAAAAFLDTFSRPEQAGTRRTYAAVMTHLLRAPMPAPTEFADGVLARLAQGEHTISELEELFSITRSAVYRALARDRARTAAT